MINPILDVRTPMTKSKTEKPEFIKLTEAVTPWGGMGNAEDVAKSVTFLASDDAAWITGSMFPPFLELAMTDPFCCNPINHKRFPKASSSHTLGKCRLTQQIARIELC